MIEIPVSGSIDFIRAVISVRAVGLATMSSLLTVLKYAISFFEISDELGLSVDILKYYD